MSRAKEFFFGVIRFVLISTFVFVFAVWIADEFTDFPLESFANSVRTVTQLSIREWVMALMILLPGIAAGGMGLSVGLSAIVSAARIGMRNRTPAKEVHLADGAVEIQGTVEPFVLEPENATDGVGVTLTAPRSGTTCVAYTWERKDREYRPTRENPTTWVTAEKDEEAVPFYVTDDTGRVAVDPTDATLSLKPAIEQKGTGTREYEGRLHPGDTVHVYGYKHETSGDDGGFAADRMYVNDRLGDDPVALGEQFTDITVFLGPPSGDGTFKISDTSELRTMLRSAAKGVVYSLGGIGLLLAATFGVYILYTS